MLPTNGVGKPVTSSVVLAIPVGIVRIAVTTTIFPAFIYVQVPVIPVLVFTVAALLLFPLHHSSFNTDAVTVVEFVPL